DNEWMDLLAEPGESQETTLANSEEFRAKKLLMDRAMATLSDRERDIVKLRHLVEDEDQVTLEELSQRYNISRERVRQIEGRALEKMTEYVMNAANAAKALPAPGKAA